MSSEIIGIIGFALAAVLALACTIFWRKAASLQSVLVEAANRFEAGRKHNHTIESDLKNLHDRFQNSRDTIAKLEKHLDEARAKVANHTKTLDAQKAAQGGENDRLQLKVDNYEQQITALTAQLIEGESGRRALQARVEELSKDLIHRKEQRETAQRAGQETNQLQDEIRKLREKVSESERDRQAAMRDAEKYKDLLKKFDPTELKKAKQRLSKMEQLYSSMKGLREMAEERNENWEVALRALSLHILQGQAVDMNLGPLVGAALEKAGAVLVVDELSHPGSDSLHNSAHTSDGSNPGEGHVSADQHHT